jgi:XRE family aerobic/anaerobic benzoate catabolism transcriptional regulator
VASDSKGLANRPISTPHGLDQAVSDLNDPQPTSDILNASPAPEADESGLMRRVGTRVRAARKERRLARRELSDRSGVSVRYLAQLESGVGNISISLLDRVANALQQPIEALVAPDRQAREDADEMAALFSKADGTTRARVLQLLAPDKARNQKAHRICLVGLRGAGKTTLGRLISKDFGVPFVELNTEIEKIAGVPSREIFGLYGNEGYRHFEPEALANIIGSRHRLVLAAPGGIVLNQDAFAQILARFHTIWIKAAPGEHMDRVQAQGDRRPAAGNPRAMIQLQQILQTRETEYRKTDFLLDTTGKAPERSHAELRSLVNIHKLL